jgi:competence protein ComGF
LIFTAKSFSSSIQRWKLFEMKISIMILKKILTSFIVKEKNSIFKN